MKYGKHDRRQILQYIIQYKRDHDGNSPKLREIMQANGVSSTNTMSYILKKMEEEGVIYYGGYDEPRAIQVVGGQWTYNG